MSDLHSPSWYRVAALRPKLRSHARIHRHHYRGNLWYVLEDRVSRRMHRFNPVAYYVIRLLGQLHAAEVLQTESLPDFGELARRAKRARKRTWLQNLLSPLSIRIPLVDPERALERWRPWYQPWFGWLGALVWCAVVGSALAAAGTHWSELTEDVTSRVLAPQNL